MSEYQYYEFHAIDRPLEEAEREALRALSSRARITATSFTNHYEWGDFKGDPKKLMECFFDLHLYSANWGTRQLMIRLPNRLVDLPRLDAFLRDVDWAEVWTSDENLIVDICRDEVEPDTDEWDDETGWLEALAPLRADVLSGDLRLFYLLWLAAIEEEGIDDGESEPLPGIAPLSGALKAFAEFLRVDPDLVQAAAERTSEVDLAAVTAETMRDILAAIPEREKTDLLVRLVEADPHVASELKMRVRMLCAQPSADLRTVGDLRARWAVVRETRKRKETERREAARRRRKKEAEKAGRARLDALKRQGTSVWREVELEIERRNASGYDRAAGLLFDLKAIAAEEGTLAGFARRLDGLHARHARKGKFIERLQGLMSH